MRPRSLWVVQLVSAIALAPAASFAAPPAKPAHKNASKGASSSKGSSKHDREDKRDKRDKRDKQDTQDKQAKDEHDEQDVAVRRNTAGGPTVDDAAMGADSPELRALYAAERELFPPASPSLGSKWPDELPFPIASAEDRPRVHSSGLPPAPPASAPPPSDAAGKDLSWIAKLDLPDLPVRWDPRVVRYLEFFRDDPRGRGAMHTWLRRSGRYRDAIKRTLKKKGLPEDLTWLAMIESGFDPTARSPVGALGLWQFMPQTGKIYGLSQDRWADERMSLEDSTEAACDFLADLYRRFGSWDLAMAAYNMGYGGLVSAVRRYNTNDYWALSKLEGSLPWETTLYVPKILAAAVVAHNLAAFGLQDLVVDPPLESEEVPVAPGTKLATVAQACGTTTKDLELLNPELRASRTPPSQHEDWPVKVPAGKAASCSASLTKTKHPAPEPATERYVVRFGESLDQIAQARRTSVSKLVELNAIAPGEVVRGGTVLLVPKAEAVTTDKPEATKGEKPVVVVPRDVFFYPDRRHVFYQVQIGDTVSELASTFHVTQDELRRWNQIDPSARLVEGMTLQVFAPDSADLSKVMALGEGDVSTIVAGTDEFFEHWDEKSRRRIVVTAKSGDTLSSIGKKFGVSTSMMERINRRGRRDPIHAGESIVVWAPPAKAAKSATTSSAQASAARVPSPTGHALEPTPPPPLGAPPAPERLPPLP
jgi:membrane-bound lytic murein transglycosylase D